MVRNFLYLWALVLFALMGAHTNVRLSAQAAAPTMLVPTLDVRPVAGGLTTPVSLAFIGTDDMLVLEKNTGQVKRIIDGVVDSTVLDLAVNASSERGLLGIAMHPNFATNSQVFGSILSESAGVF